jgi:predicted alpha/beta-fold hydrolase
MKFLRCRFPNRRFYAVGFSLGANILCNVNLTLIGLTSQYLGEEGKDSPFVAASSVCNPWQLKVTADALFSTVIGRQLYCKTMGLNLKRVFMRQYAMMKDHPKIDWKAFKKAQFIHGISPARRF